MERAHMSDSVRQVVEWKLQGHYEVPPKLVGEKARRDVFHERSPCAPSQCSMGASAMTRQFIEEHLTP